MTIYQQNTPEWLEMRKTKIGASDAPVIIGANHYSSWAKLWRLKKGIEVVEDNEFMQHGRKYEDVAKEQLEKDLGQWLEPVVFFHPKVDFMMASLDGINPTRSCAVEIKCPCSRKTHEIALQGQVPAIYYAQLQHQMECAEIEWIYYYSFFVEDDTFEEVDFSHVLLKVERNEPYIQEMISKEKEFFEWMKKDTSPPRQKRPNMEIGSARTSLIYSTKHSQQNSKI